MKKINFILILIFLVNLTVFSKDLKFLWWNVQNFFDASDDPEKEDTVLSEDAYNGKLKGISEKLLKLKADIVGLAEVENLAVLKDIASKSGYPYYYLVEGNDPRGIDVCLLSKYKIKYMSFKNFPTPHKGNVNYKFSRDCPLGILTLDNMKIYILVTHLKSKLKDKENTSDLKRNAQIGGILDIIAKIYEANKDEPNILMMGDFNALRYSGEMNILQKSGLKIINYLFNEEDHFTFVYKNKKQTVDYMIMSKKYFDKVSIKKFICYNGEDYRSISDHFPILMEVSF